jgi:hypothetical protein
MPPPAARPPLPGSGGGEGRGRRHTHARERSRCTPLLQLLLHAAERERVFEREGREWALEREGRDQESSTVSEE